MEIAAAPAAPVRLYPARPNPFKPHTTLSFRIDQAGPVRLALYDVQGRLVRELVRGDRPAGTHDVAWDGTDSRGDPLRVGRLLRAPPVGLYAPPDVSDATSLNVAPATTSVSSPASGQPD